MAWHNSFTTRKAIGDTLETRFSSEARCSCGGRFSFIGDQYPGCPDFTCESCGLLVDVKYSPQASKTGNLAISATPWKNYPDDLVIVTDIGGGWIGQTKGVLTTPSRVLKPTHQERGTSFVLISLGSFVPLADVGINTY